MFDKNIFEIGIYRCSEKAFNEKYARDLKAHCLDVQRRGGTHPDTWSKDFYLTVEHYFWDNYIAPWPYNQAIGWVRLYLLGSQLRGTLWLVDAKRCSRSMKHKKFRHQGDAFQMEVWPEQSSAGIYKELLEQLRSTQMKWRSRGWVLDLECLHAVGPFINWRGLVSSPDS